MCVCIPAQVIAIINAALRNKQAQPWMYEALGLAMQANAAAPEEIERALMSAVDFNSKSSDLMAVADAGIFQRERFSRRRRAVA